MLLGGAAINRKFALRALYPEGKESDVQYDPGVFYCKDAFEGLAVMDRLIEPEQPRGARRGGPRRRRRACARSARRRRCSTRPTTPCARAVRTDVEVPEPPFWGVREIEVDRDELYTHLDTHVLFKLHWGGRGVKGEEWRKLLDEDFRPRLERMWAEADYLHPRALLGYFPCYSEGNDIVVLDPEDRETVLERFTCPRQPKGDRLCLADFYRPKESGELDVVALQTVTVGSEVTELMAKLEAGGRVRRAALRPRPRRPDRRGPGRVAALARAQRPRDRRHARAAATRGATRPCPDQSEHLKVEKLLDISQIGMEISDGYAPIPEQSTLALVCHHPQAGYYGMRNGRLLPDGSPDDVIRGTPRDPSRSRTPNARRRPPRRASRADVRRLVVALAVLALSGRGENTDDNAVRRAATDYLQAFAAGDGAKACALMLPEVQKTLGDCPGTLEKAVKAMSPDEVAETQALVVDAVTSAGDNARVRFTPGALPARAAQGRRPPADRRRPGLAEERGDVGREQARLLGGGEVAAAAHVA